MISIKNLTVRNFMSVGNATQGVDFDRNDLTLVLGENLDLGGDGSRNGTGKTTIINALSYALYGQALSNIRKDNLVNKTNGKNMLVSLDFHVDGVDYKIERGRKPNVLKFYVNHEAQSATDEAQGDSRETQDAIERVLGMSHDMFQHITALNTYTPAFLSLKANEQRTIIEQLLGITLLSEKADRIKELNRQTKEAIQAEELRIRAVQEANKRIEEQIESLRKRQRMWIAKRDEDVGKLEAAVSGLEHIDIDAEIQAHRDLDAFHKKQKQINDFNKQVRLLSGEIGKLERERTKIEQDLASLASHRCHACGQDVHDSKHEEIREAKLVALAEANTAWEQRRNELVEYENELEELGELGTVPSSPSSSSSFSYSTSSLRRCSHAVLASASATSLASRISSCLESCTS